MKQKQNNYSRRSRWLLPIVMFFALLTSANPAWGDELTVYDGTNKNSYIPLYGGYSEAALKGEFIIPATELADMDGCIITGIKFYAETNNSTSKPTYGTDEKPFQVFLKEVENATYPSTSFFGTEGATVVYEGTLVVSSKEMAITFTNNYTYHGGNLLIGLYKDAGGAYLSNNFYGISQSDYYACNAYSNSGISYITTGTKRQFIPKTTFTYESVVSGPDLRVYDGSTKLTTGYNYDFGLATAGTEKTFKLKNPGTEATPISVEATGGFGATISDNATSIPAGGEVTLTVTMANETGNGTVTVSSKADGIDDFIINVSGTVRDPNKVYLDFLDGQMPKGWTTTGYSGSWSSYNWVVSTGYISYEASSSTYVGTFTSPLLTFTEGEQIFFETAKYGSATYSTPSITVEYSTDGSTWTAIGSAFTDDIYGEWTTRSVTIPNAGAQYIRFKGWYIHLRNIYGGEEPEGASFAINTDGSTQNIGISSINGKIAEKTFTITNDGSASLQVTFTPSEGFSVPNYVVFTDVLGWGSPNVYYWGGESSISWPGIAMTEIGMNEYDQKQYKAVIPTDATGIIFNNGDGGKQTVDINYSASTEGYYTINSQDGSGHYNVSSWGDGPGWNVAAGESRSFTVQMSNETAGTKSGNIVLDFNALNATTFTIPVSGVVLPEGAMFVDFADGLPDGWANDSWTIENGEATGKSSSAYLTTPKLSFSEGDYFAIKLRNYDSSSSNYITIQGSSDNGATWTAYNNKILSTQFSSTTEWSTLVINDIPTTVNKLRFVGYYVVVDEIDGLTYDANNPMMGIFASAEAEAEKITATAVTEDWDFLSEDKGKTYYIRNTGTGTLSLSLNEAPAGITVQLPASDLEAGEQTGLLFSIKKADNGGWHGGDIVLTGKDNSDNVVGTFTISVQGVIMEDGKFDLDFTTADIPTAWTNGPNGTYNKFEKNAGGYITPEYSSASLETTKLVATAGETLVVMAKNTSSSSSYTVGVKYKNADDAEAEWQDLIPAANNYSSDFKMLHGTIAEAGNYLLQFNGSYAQIQRIYGLAKPNAPEMVVYDGESVASDSHNFDKVTDEADATWTLTVKNEGLAKLEGLAVALTGDNADHYTAVITNDQTEIEAGESATITVTQLKDNLGTHEATLTISATDLDSKVITLSGETVDHTLLNIDFATADVWPTEIVKHGDYWNVKYGTANQTSSTASSSMIITPLTVAATTDKFNFKVQYYSSSQSSKRDLVINYTTDGGLTWTPYNWGTESEPETSLKSQISGSLKSFEITNIPAGTVAFDFYGQYISVDDISGDMKVASAPLVTFTETANNIDGANLKADATATYTLANNGNADYVATVATTNVTAEVAGDDVTFAENTLTVPAGKTATITVTMAYAAPYGEKTGNLSITSESWVGDIEASYTATLVDPTAFVEDFSGKAKPAGWYAETAGSAWSGWYFGGGNASINTGTAKKIITEKIGAEDGKNVLSFDAKVYNGTDEKTLNVYTSTDRKNWSDAQSFTLTGETQTFKLEALADGEYYVKFEAQNATIYNVKGVKKLDAPAHDLYEVSTDMPTESKVPGSSYTATVKAISLRADETVVAELWAKKDEDYNKVAELTGQAMTVDTEKTFTLTGDLPAEEGDYTMWVTVKNPDVEGVYFNTEEKVITLKHTKTMAISDFQNAAAVQADDDNEFSATFFVTVENTGSSSIAANDVEVTLINNADAEDTFTAKWTAANSNVLYMNTKKNDVDIATGCTLKAWCWNTDDDGEWINFTNINEGFWSLDLNGKTNFKICRVNPDGTAENPWDNVWNQSGDLSLTDGNLVKFDYYSGETLNFTSESMAYLEPTMTTTLKVTVTGSVEETSNVYYKAMETVSKTYYSLTRYVHVNAADPILVTIGATGYTTFASSRGMNLDNLPDGIEAYYIVADDIHPATQSVALTPATGKVVSGTGLIFKGKASWDYEVKPAKSESGSVLDGNLLVGCVEETPVAVDADKYVLVSNEGEPEFQSLAEHGATIPAGKAYLDASGIGAGARLSIVFGDDDITTGIAALKQLGKDGRIYNLNGQHVENPKKGSIYIVDGKKVVIK